MYLVLGCFIDTTSMMVVTLPFIFPLGAALQIDPIWFGIMLVKLVEIAVITPPVGFNLFAALSATGGKASFEDASRGVIPFVVLELGVLALLVAFPAITLWLPGRCSDDETVTVACRSIASRSRSTRYGIRRP